MGFMRKLLVFGLIVGIAAVLYPLFITPEFELPKVEDQWFGKTKLKKGEPIPKDPIGINKFAVNVSDVVLEDLRKRLELARFVEPIEGTQFNYGFNANYLKQVIEYWKTKYDWRKQEKELNKFNQFTTQIEGINIHFIHVKPSKPAKTVVPLMVIHGWPGSVWEYYKAIPLLTEPTDGIAFEIICPSIPGYGFSEAPHQEGFDVVATARIFVKLMNRLSHKSFFVHGGDWGSIISKSMALLHSQNVRGIHTTLNSMFKMRGMAAIKFFTGMFFPSLVFENPENDYKKMFPFLDKLYFLLRESGYMHIQSTKPDTVGAALIDSPVGLAAYILEKFSTWTNPNNVKKLDGGLTEKFTLDELLTNVMIYWTSNNVASSMRYYKESFVRLFNEYKLDQIPVKESVPSAVADFPYELARMPKEFAHYQYHNLVQYTEMPRGGHFGAFEEPKLVSDDIKKFVKTVLDNQQNENSKA
jgi:microsomal epoxide hydrolase